jgi:hypothetical protein
MKKRRDHFKTGDKRIMSFLSQRRRKKELIRKKWIDYWSTSMINSKSEIERAVFFLP